MITVIPVAQTVINWVTLQQVTSAATGRSVARPLDERKIEARGLAEAIAALGEFHQEGVEYTFTLRNPGSLLRHFAISFLIVTQSFDFVAEIAFDGDLKILECEDSDRLFIASATLEQWRTTLINLSTPRATRLGRIFSREIISAFDKMGLSQIWENYARSGGSELILTEK